MANENDNPPYTLLDGANKQYDVWGVNIDNNTDTIEFCASFAQAPAGQCQLRRNSDGKSLPIVLNNFIVEGKTVRWAAVALVGR